MKTQRISLIILWGIIFTLILIPREIIFGENVFFSFCIHQVLLDFECPGCGMTRAVYSFLHFEFLESLKLNFAVVGLIPFLIFKTLCSFFNKNQLGKIYSNLSYFFIFLLTLVYLIRIINHIF